MINLITIHTIGEMKKEGFTQKEIAKLLGLTQSTISKVLSGVSGNKVREIADRMEYFTGGAAGGTGCYLNGIQIKELVDPTFEEVAFDEMLQNIELFEDH